VLYFASAGEITRQLTYGGDSLGPQASLLLQKPIRARTPLSHVIAQYAWSAVAAKIANGADDGSQSSRLLSAQGRESAESPSRRQQSEGREIGYAAEEEDRAAAAIQSAHRGKLQRRRLEERRQAAVKLQSMQRGKATRKQSPHHKQRRGLSSDKKPGGERPASPPRQGQWRRRKQQPPDRTAHAALTLPDKASRDELFARFDANGNGGLSLAEVDKAVLELYPEFNNKPALLRAHSAADVSGDGFIGRCEFRLLLE
jgi:hypothetical protein